MGFNPKNIITSCVNYPFVLCFVLIAFVVYTFLPDYLNLLIYSSPSIVFITVVHRVFVSTHRKRIKDKSSKEEPKSVQNEDKNEKEVPMDTNSRLSNQTHTTRRRNVTEKNKEEIPKENREVKVDSANQNIARSSLERGSSEETDDEDDETQRDRNKAVEWTEEDEKSVMDLGLSEIERNKRLESLIARRRSRKWLNLQARRIKNLATDPAAQVASILVSRNNPFLANASDSQTSPTPGSAPSVLLPMRNPFDLPYDPQEEKPNLTGDEFHQEFMAAHQKEIMFCRHESFVRGPFDRADNNRGRNGLDRIRTKQMVHGDGSSSTPKGFKAKRDSILKSPKIAAWKRIAAERRENFRTNEFLFDSGPSIFGRITMRERRYHSENEPHHTQTNSFASDMQVEVSESSSPPLTVDGDEESSSLNDKDMEKKISVGIEEMFGASSHLAEVDKNESSSREIHEISEFDIMQVGFSRNKQKHRSEPVSAHLSPVKDVEQGPFDSNSFPHSKIGLLVPPRPSGGGDNDKAKIQDQAVEQGNGEVPSAGLPELLAQQISTTSSSSASPKSDLQNKGTTPDQASSSTVDQDINVGSHQTSGFSQHDSPYGVILEKITPAVPHNTPVLARDSMNGPSNGRGFENAQEFAIHPEKDDNKEKKMDGEDEILIKQENERDESKPSDKNYSESTEDIVGQLDKPTDKIAENSTRVERNEIPESSENRGEDSSVNRQSVNESIEQASITTTSVLSPKSVLNQKFSINSMSSLSQDYGDEQQPHTDEVDNNPAVEISHENSAPVAPQNSTLDSTSETINHSIISQDNDSAAVSKPDEPSENDSAASSKQAEPSENLVALLTKTERSVEGETNTSSNANESSVADNMDSKDSSSQSIEGSGDRN